MSKDYGSWSIADLKNELRKRKAKIAGKKAVLVQRLMDYDTLFGPLVTEPESVFKISLPAPETFKDVTTDSRVPQLTSDALETFCQLTERNDVTTSKNMYNDNFLMACRIAVDNTEYFLTGLVASEMRKHNIFYNVAVKMKHTIVLEAQCECAAGMGPFAQCKHVLVLLYAIIDWNQNKTIKLKKSATNTLQTFHQPNIVYTGNPFKAESLKLKVADNKFKKMVTFDPRPLEERPIPELFREDFKNQVRNFCGQVKEKICMPMVTMLEPVDKKATFDDHKYLSTTAEEQFLQSLILTQNELQDLEKNTLKNKKIWSRERLKRLQSSNFGKICKSSSLQLAKSLSKNTNITTAAMKHGLKYESEAVQKFENLIKRNTVKCGIIVHKDYQYLACTPDRLVDENFVLEVKCPYTARNKQISPETVPYLFLCDKTGQLQLYETHDYYYQVQGQIMCTGRKSAYFCIYTITDFVIIKIEKNEVFIKTMHEKLLCFYNKFFKDIIVNRYLYNKK